MALSSKTTFQWKGLQMIGATKRGAVTGVNRAAIRLEGHSVEKAPVDQSNLRGSANTVPATEAQANPTAVLVFDEPYAAVQHEDETLNHTQGAAGEPAGEAKYVSSNFAEHRDEYRDIIGKGIQDALGSV